MYVNLDLLWTAFFRIYLQCYSGHTVKGAVWLIFNNMYSGCIYDPLFLPMGKKDTVMQTAEVCAISARFVPATPIPV